MRKAVFNGSVVVAVLTAAANGSIEWPGVLVTPEHIVQIQKVLFAALSVWAVALHFILKASNSIDDRAKAHKEPPS
jgi:hypothetical protein